MFGTPRSEDAAETSALRDMAGSGTCRHPGCWKKSWISALIFRWGARATALSGGQRQKIAIARAFLKEAPILILDEATASLDNMSQGRIQRYLEADLGGKTTVIAVLHRLDVTPAYDRIVVLKNGALVESGKFEELIEKKGAFYELFQGQG